MSPHDVLRGEIYRYAVRPDSQRLATIARNPLAFALRVGPRFRENQGLLPAGAVAYYSMLSLVWLLMLTLMVLPQFLPQAELLAVLTQYLEFVVPAQSHTLVGGLRAFLEDRARVGVVLFATMLSLLLSAIYLVMSVGRLSARHALTEGGAAAALWEMSRHALSWYYATVSKIQVVYGTFAASVGVLLSVELGARVRGGTQIIAEFEHIAPSARKE